MLNISEFTSKRILLFDGAMGTMIQQHGLMRGELPELLNITHPDIITQIHSEYVRAGSDVVSANTFQANELKLTGEYDVEAVITAGVRCARESGARFVALDVGPTGQMMEPMGPINFDRAYDIYSRQVIAGAKAGADVVIIETISDPYEMKAALLAAKDNTDLPVICSMTFREEGRTFVGCDALTATVIMQNLGADAIGVNCSLGPELLSPVVETMLKYSKVPVIVQANAGLPVMRGGKSEYELEPEAYVGHVMEMVGKGVRIVGGCCGTNPEYIRLLKEKTEGVLPFDTAPVSITACTSARKTVIIENPAEIGEMLDSADKKKMQEALLKGDLDYVIDEAIAQTQAGAQILHIDAGLCGIDEPSVLVEAVKAVQSASGMPLMLGGSCPEAIEAAARVYNGIPVINSVNDVSIEKIMPIAEKYGAVVANNKERRS